MSTIELLIFIVSYVNVHCMPAEPSLWW